MMQVSPHGPFEALDRGMPKKARAAWQAAQNVESAFLAEMLKSAGLAKPSEALGGGAGEDQFSSMLVRHQAEQLTRAGGIGLTEVIFNALTRAENDKQRPE